MTDNWYDDEAQVARRVASGEQREIIGGLWDEVGRLQLDFLRRQGLEPHHTLLDIGCGSGRFAVKAVPYLEPNHYFGIDLSPSLLVRSTRRARWARFDRSHQRLHLSRRQRLSARPANARAVRLRHRAIGVHTPNPAALAAMLARDHAQDARGQAALRDLLHCSARSGRVPPRARRRCHLRPQGSISLPRGGHQRRRRFLRLHRELDRRMGPSARSANCGVHSRCAALARRLGRPAAFDIFYE